MPADPLILRLPISLAQSGFNLARLIAADPGRNWSDGYRLLELFEVSRPERQFALSVLRRKTNLWLFRCNQRAFCGDFIVVNMSPPRPEARAAWVLELKQRAPLGTAGGIQLKNADAAVDELTRHTVVGAGCPTLLLSGSSDVVLDLLCGRHAVP